MDPFGVDMNDPKVLSLYSKLLVFAQDSSKIELLFNTPDHHSKRALQCLSSKLNLEYEYSLAIDVARITHIPETVIQEPLVHSKTPQELFPDFDALLDPQLFDDNSDFASSLADAKLFDDFINFPTSPPSLPTRLPFEDDSKLQSGNQSQNNPSNLSGSDQASPLWTTRDTFVHERRSFRGPLASHINLTRNNSYETMDMAEARIPYGSYGSCGSYGSYGSYGSSPDPRIYTKNGVGSPLTFSQRLARESRRPSVSSRSSISAGSNTSSRRRGPLSVIARASMSAVKAVGACWRCKVLKKQCDPATPCAICPRKRTAWGIIGCKRGDLSIHSAPLNLCPKLATKNGEFGFENEPNLGPATQFAQDVKIANLRWHRAIKRRAGDTVILEPLMTIRGTALDVFIRKLENREPILKGIGSEQETFKLSNLLLESSHENLSASRVTDSMGFMVPPVPNHPLDTSEDQNEDDSLPSGHISVPWDSCIIDIIWELINCPHSEYLKDESFEAEIAKLCVLLRSASIYQAKYTHNQLIVKSLDCLRASLEALNLKLSNKLDCSIHTDCDTDECKFLAISNLNVSLDSYLAELSQVFFKKENLRSKDWWLSVFYSLCIQAIVRSTLLGLVEGRLQDFPSHQPQGLKEYLHAAVRLFIASSKDYDPMMATATSTKQSNVGGKAPEEGDYEAARLALSWNDSEYQSSANYLKHLFEDDGEPLMTDT